MNWNGNLQDKQVEWLLGTRDIELLIPGIRNLAVDAWEAVWCGHQLQSQPWRQRWHDDMISVLATQIHTRDQCVSRLVSNPLLFLWMWQRELRLQSRVCLYQWEPRWSGYQHPHRWSEARPSDWNAATWCSGSLTHDYLLQAGKFEGSKVPCSHVWANTIMCNETMYDLNRIWPQHMI